MKKMTRNQKTLTITEEQKEKWSDPTHPYKRLQRIYDKYQHLMLEGDAGTACGCPHCIIRSLSQQHPELKLEEIK